MRKSKTWSYSDIQVEFPICKKRFNGFTLFGAIGNCLARPVMMTSKSTNKESFFDFLDMVNDALKPGITKPILVIDNHPAHKSNLVKEKLHSLFDVMWLPRYSCEFNSQESVWAYIKREFKAIIGIRVGEVENYEELD